MNPLLLPRWGVARELYPTVLQAVLDYAALVDEAGDGSLETYRALEERLQGLTGKDLSAFHLYEWWEEEGAEVLAFRIAMPDPPKLERRLSREEVADVVDRLLSGSGEFSARPERDEDAFVASFSLYLDVWYRRLLEWNAPRFDVRWFHRQQDRQGNWFEHGRDDLLDLLLGLGASGGNRG